MMLMPSSRETNCPRGTSSSTAPARCDLAGIGEIEGEVDDEEDGDASLQQKRVAGERRALDVEADAGA